MSDFNVSLLIVLSFCLLMWVAIVVNSALQEKSKRISRILTIIERTVDRPLSHLICLIKEGYPCIPANNGKDKE